MDYADTHPRARSTDPDTSREAAQAARKTQPTVRLLVQRYADQHPEGFTDEELVKAIPQYKPSGVRSRRKELTKENWIFDTGRKRQHGTSTHHTVWTHRKNVPNAEPVKAYEPTKSQWRIKAEELTALIGDHPEMHETETPSEYIARVEAWSARAREAIQ